MDDSLVSTIFSILIDNAFGGWYLGTIYMDLMAKKLIPHLYNPYIKKLGDFVDVSCVLVAVWMFNDLYKVSIFIFQNIDNV